MANKRIRTKKIPSNLPYVMVGIWWAIGTFVLPMYRLSSYMLLGGIGIGMFLILQKLHVFKDTEIQYEEEIPFEEMELEDVLAEGYGYLADLQKSNEKIADEQMTRGIEEVVKISDEILKEVKKNPRNLKDIRKFISYYLPTLSYLLQQYTEMDTKDDTFSNVSLTKEKIKNMLKTVEEAFRQQYNSLFEDEVTDVSVEIKVLENMMAQEGLIKEKEVLH